MIKSLVIGASFSLCLCACASAPATRATSAQAAVAPAMIGCVPDTATRLPPLKSGCASFGRSYTGTDIQRTGQVYTDQALGLLDPAITGGRH
ncbi:MAG TPA: hypothetical protein VEU54_01665 [Steroidobacteraceae bacterium]|jgi:hypothetical protein|nr:hypothetical protein [Steroidobacteraceae bacterium]